MPSSKFDGFKKVDSGHLDGVKYESSLRVMQVRFQNGYVYSVHGVSPELYKEFLDAPSQGEFYHQHIKGSFHVERTR